MLNFRHVSQNREGFTLIELVLWIAIFSILIMSFFSLFKYVNAVLSIGDSVDEVLSSGRYGIEYIKKEILNADKIIPSYKFKDLDYIYPNNFNFVIFTLQEIVNEKTNTIKYKYNYSTYYLKDDELTRIAINKDTKSLPDGNDFSGYNQLCTNVLNIENTSLNISSSSINLHFIMGGNGNRELSFKTKLYLNCPVEN